MKIFISWSGERSQVLALALRDWLPLVLYYADPWLSTSDIKSGDRWSIEVAKGLQESKFGIICVTRDNLESPWLLFESGALAKSMEDGRVVPLRLDLDQSDISGPLTQFQSEKADADGIRRLVLSLNKVAATPVVEDRLVQLFDATWARLEQKIQEVPPSEAPQKRARPQTEILEELVSGVRNVEMRVREMSDEESGLKRRSRRRFDPMMMHMMHRMTEDPSDPIHLLIVASAFRDDLPWIYELALDTYRSMKSDDPLQAGESLRKLKDTVEMLRRGPFLEMAGLESRGLHMALLDTVDSLQNFETGLIAPKSLRRVRARPAASSEK